MAVFMINICKFNGCGITFPSLGDLIQHIEDTHIDYDPLVLEQKEASQPTCLPLSYVLRFFTEATRREYHLQNERKKILPHTNKSSSVRSETPTGSDFDEDEYMTQSEDSNDSWTAVEEYSADFILKNGTRQKPSTTSKTDSADKPFACPVPGCKKRYKNINGIKYHSKNGHKKDGKVKKPYRCHCGKSYTSAQGLKSHAIANHIANTINQPNIQQPKTVTVARNSQSNRESEIVENKLLKILEAAKTQMEQQQKYNELQLITSKSGISRDNNNYTSQINARFIGLVKHEEKVPKLLIRTNKLHTGYTIDNTSSILKNVPSYNTR